MAISIYDRPAEQPLMDTYVPIPFQELAAAGQAKQTAYNRGLELEDTIESQLGETPALSRINLPGSGVSVDINDANMVKAKVSEFETKISELVSEHKDKSSPEYQMAMRGIVKDLKKSFGSQGVFGRAKANVQTMKDLNKLTIDNPDIARHRYSTIGRQLLSGVSEDGVSNLSYSSGVGKGVNLQDELTGFLKNKKARFNPKLTSRTKDGFGLINTVTGETLTAEEVEGDAMNLINTSPEMQDELLHLVQDAELRGQTIDVEKYKRDLAKIMGSLFMQNEVDLTSKFDPYDLELFKKSLKGEEEEAKLPDMSFQGVVQDANVKATGTPFLMKAKVEELEGNAERADLEYKAILNKLDVDGRYIEDGVDVSYKVADAAEAKQNADRELLIMNQYDLQARRAAGITDEQIESSYSNEQIAEAKQERMEIMEGTKDSKSIEGRLKYEAYANDPESWMRFLPDKDKNGVSMRSKKSSYNDILKKDSETRTKQINFKRIDGKLSDDRTTLGWLNSAPIKSLLSSGNQEVRWHKSDDISALSSDDYENVDHTKTQVHSWSTDERPGMGGQLIIKMNLYDGDGKSLGVAETRAPEGFKERVLGDGSKAASSIDLHRQFLNGVGSVENSPSREGNITVGYNPESKTEVRVRAGDATQSQPWEALLPSKNDPNTLVATPFDNRNDLMQAMINLGLAMDAKARESK